MRSLIVALVISLAGALAGPAFAEDLATYEVEGEADAAGSEPRVTALDEAFSKAVAQALGDLLGADARKANKAALDKEITGRARLWVTRFSVIKDETVDGRRQLTVTVRVDRDKMRARLEQLDIANAPDPAQGGAGRAGVILMRVTDSAGLRATYGANAEREIPGYSALASSLRGSGVALKRATAAGPAAKPDGDLPLDDEQAESLADAAKAELGVIAGVNVGTAVPVRGVDTTAAQITARVRVVARGKKVVGQGSATVASRGSDATAINAAIDRAVVAAIADAMPAAQTIEKPATFSGDDTPIAEPGIVLIKVPGKTPYALVAAELKYLSGAKGISRAALHRVSPGGWVIGVATSESVQKIAGIVRKPPSPDTSVQAKVVGDVVELTITGAK